MDFELLLEAERRGILPPDKAALLAEARRRGLVPSQPEATALTPVPPSPTLAKPETTAAGVAGGMTRALTLPVAGGTAGFMFGGTPGAVAGTTAAVLAPVVADPLVDLFNRTFGTNVQQPSEALSQLFTRLGVPVPRTGAEQFVQKATEGVVAGTAVPAQAGRTVAAMVQGTRAAPVVTPIAEAVRVGGMGPTGGATMGQRVGAGMTAGAIGAAPVAETPTDVTLGAVGGGITPPAVKVGKEAVTQLWRNIVDPLRKPALVAERQLFRAVGGTPGAAERAIGEIQAGLEAPTTPGFQPTLPELMVAGGGEAPPTLSVLAERVRGATPQQAREIERLMNQRVGALQAQLARVNQQIDQQGAMLQPGALDELTQTRDAILRNLENEQAQVESVLRASAGQLPIGPQEAGEAIAARAQQLSKNLRETEVQPAYTRAQQAAGNTRINIDTVVTEAERVLGRPLSSFAPDTAPAIVRRIRALRPAEPEAQPLGAGLVSSRLRRAPAGPPEPTTATLADLDDLRKAINADVVAAARGAGSLAGVETRNLLALQRTIDSAIDGSDTLPQQAKDLYRAALKTYRESYAPRFREGETGRILKPAMFGEMRIEPSQIVKQFTKDTDAAKQFVTTFAGDPQAFESLRNGILGQFRLAAVDAQTGLVKPDNAAKFLQANAEQFAVLDNAGLGIRRALQQFEQDAIQGNEVLTNLAAIGGGFRDKTPDQILKYILGSGDRMGIALSRLDDTGKNTIRRVVQTRLNQMLTQTKGGAPLTEKDAMDVVNEIIDPTGKLKPAYEKALGRDLANEFADRAKGLRLVIETGKDPMLKNPNAIAPLLRSQNFTPAQLTDLQVVVDDIARANKVAEAARAAKASARPSGRDVLKEELEEGTFRPDRLNLLNTTYTFLRNVFIGVRDRINPKISAQLANMIYNNPDAAITALRNEIARAQRVAKPAGVSRALPAAYGAAYGGISAQNRPQEQPQE